jgi:hypothetical protein
MVHRWAWWRRHGAGAEAGRRCGASFARAAGASRADRGSEAEPKLSRERGHACTQRTTTHPATSARALRRVWARRSAPRARSAAVRWDRRDWRRTARGGGPLSAAPLASASTATPAGTPTAPSSEHVVGYQKPPSTLTRTILKGERPAVENVDQSSCEAERVFFFSLYLSSPLHTTVRSAGALGACVVRVQPPRQPRHGADRARRSTSGAGRERAPSPARGPGARRRRCFVVRRRAGRFAPPPSRRPRPHAPPSPPFHPRPPHTTELRKQNVPYLITMAPAAAKKTVRWPAAFFSLRRRRRRPSLPPPPPPRPRLAPAQPELCVLYTLPHAPAGNGRVTPPSSSFVLGAPKFSENAGPDQSAHRTPSLNLPTPTTTLLPNRPFPTNRKSRRSRSTPAWPWS